MNFSQIVFTFIFTLTLLSFSVQGATKRSGSFAVGPVDNVIEHLNSFQSASGGFFDKALDASSGTGTTVSATKDGLFLGSLFSLPNVNRTSALDYISNLRNADGGYSESQQDLGVSSLGATANAVFAFAQLGVPPPHTDDIAEYLQSRVDADSGLVTDGAGQVSLHDTLQLFQTLSVIEHADDDWVTKSAESVRNYLEKAAQRADNTRFFSPPAGSENPLSDNLYAIELSGYVDYTLPALAEWAEYFVRAQAADGCFYPSPSDASAGSSAVLASRAVRALHRLQSLQTENSQLNFVELLNIHSLLSCVQSNLEQSVSSVAEYALTYAHAGLYRSLFDYELVYEATNAASVGEDTVIQGTSIAPSIRISTRYGVHALLEAQVTFQSETGRQNRFFLAFSRDAMAYRVSADSESVAFDTSNELGTLNIYFVLQQYVPTVGALRFYVQDSRLVGYGINVDVQAQKLDGTIVEQGGQVESGTNFEFDLSLFTQESSEPLDIDEFEIEFLVAESSGLLIFQDVVDAAEGNNDLAVEDEDEEEEGSKSVHIAYQLDRNDLPAGPLNFIFQIDGVRDDGSTYTHTRHSLQYTLASRMVATNVEVSMKNGGSLDDAHIGNVIVAQMQPGSSDDFKSVHYFENGPSADQRTFTLDLVTAQGSVAQSVTATSTSPAGEGVIYHFEMPIAAEVSSIGDFGVQFRFVAANKDETVLFAHELSPSADEQTSQVAALKVSANLVLVDSSEISVPAKLLYGRSLNLSFSLKDTVSGEQLISTSAQGAGVFFAIQQGSSFYSAHERIQSSPFGVYTLDWKVSANAVSGQGTFSLQAEDVDGNVIGVLHKEDGTSLSRPIEIGGVIDSDSFTYSTNTLTASKTVFLSVFSLACEGEKLSDAKLFGSIYRDGAIVDTLEQLPVATTASGEYSISWTLPVDQAPSGIYEIRLVRNVDIERSSSSNIQNVQPLLVLSISHTNLADNKLPVRAEFVLIVLLALIFFKVYQKFPVPTYKKKK